MVLPVQFLHPVASNVRIDLGRRHVTVPEQHPRYVQGRTGSDAEPRHEARPTQCQTIVMSMLQTRLEGNDDNFCATI
jgi:hypothetical protein